MRKAITFVVLILSIQTVLCASNIGENVFSSDAFVDAIGVNTHFSYSGGKNDVWDKQYDALCALVHESGMRSIRDNVRQGTKFGRINSIYEKYGIRVNAIAFQKNASVEDVVNKLTDQWIETFRKSINPKAVISFEGPNEYNDTRQENSQWAQNAIRMQQALFTKVRSCKEYDSCEIIAPSVWYRIHDDFTALSKLRVAEFSTRSCTHYYTGGRMPTQFKRHAKFDAGTWCSLDEVIPDATALVPGKPMWVTETGYGYLTDARDGSTPISEASVGKYMPRLLAEWFRSGVVERIFIYSLVDDVKPYGLVRYNLEKRPAFFAVKHLLSALADPGEPFSPKAFPCTLSGGTADIHSLVLGKRNGEIDLLLWQEVPSWNIDTKQELKPEPVRITVTFPRPVSGDIVIPGQKPEPGMPGGSFVAQNQIDISVPDEILIIRIK